MIPLADTSDTPSNLFTGFAARPADSSFPSASPADSSASSTISSNDFLTLLVTEMKNQDPTNSTDPNEYINQLVSVNSLEQLIQINQTLSGALYSGTGATPGTTPSASNNTSAPHSAAVPMVTSGNLGLPPANPAAQQVALALSPHPRA